MMWNVDSSPVNHQHLSDHHPSIPHPTHQQSPPSMLPGPTSQSIIPEPSSSTTSNPPRPHPPPSIPQQSSHPYGIHHPTIIRSLIRRFSPPFKPFESLERETDEESVASLDSPIIIPSMLTTDLPSNQFLNPSNADVIMLSASQPHPLVMMASASKPKRSESMFGPLGGELTEASSPGDEVLKQFTLNSDAEMQDSSSLKRPRRRADRSTRQDDLNPFTHHHPPASRPSHPSNPSTHPVASAPTSDPFRHSARSSNLRESNPHHALPSPSDVDEDLEITVGPKPKHPSTNGTLTAGRAATARRALFNGHLHGLPLDREQPSEPVPSSSNNKITSPRLYSTRRHSPHTLASPTRLPGSGSSANGDDHDEPTTLDPHGNHADLEPVKKSRTKSTPSSSRPKRPKPPPSPTAPSVQPDTPPPCNSSSKNDAKRRTATLLPATQPDEFGQYESSTCHQCRVKTTRPKMICDQSQDPNCVVRVCHTCLMVRTVYDDMPDLRPPIFQFVPGGTMLCVKCRDICPCASCRRRRGEKEQCRRGMGSGLKGFYGMSTEEREQAFSRKKEKQEAARLKKESRAQSEKKTPSTYRRELTTTRGNYDDDEHERLQHWAPLPVFPPLPKRRRKKRKRLDIMEGVRLDSQASDTDSDSSGSDSDSDTCEDSESDSRSLSSVSSFHSTNRPHVMLETVPFQLPLSSNTRRTVPLLTKRWRSNLSRSLEQDGSKFSNHLYPAADCKSHGDKAPVVWIKSGAMVQARKPPTTEFMQRLAAELKGRSSADSTTAPAVVDPTVSSVLPPNSVPPIEGPASQSHDSVGFNDSVMDLDRTATSKPSSPTESKSPKHGPNSDLCLPSGLSGEARIHSVASNYSETLVPLDENQSKITCSCTIGNLQCSVEALDMPLGPHSEKCQLFTSSHFSKPIPLGEHMVMCPDGLNSTPPPLMVGSLDQGEFADDVGIKSFRTLDATNTPALRSNEDEFVPGSSPVDHQTYLAGLTDEQLSAVLKEGNYVMATRGFLPSTINSDGLPKYDDNHQFASGISPELLSASLPLGLGLECDPITEASPEGEPSSPSGPMLADLSEEDQEARVIEAANWAAVWGATDGAGGFVVTKLAGDGYQAQVEEGQAVETDERPPGFAKVPPTDVNLGHHPNGIDPAGVIVNGQQVDNHHYDPSSPDGSHWVLHHHPSGADRELFLRAMKSRVGDEWLTDVMPLDSC